MSANPSSTAATAGAQSGMARVIYLKLVLTSLFWGGTFIAGRVIAPVLPPMTAATGRYAIAVILLYLLARRSEGDLPRLTGKQWGMTAALGLTGMFIYNVCFFGALKHMPAGRAALFIALNPAATALAAALLLRERMSVSRWLGIALAFVGAAIIITRGEPWSALTHLSQSFGIGEVFMVIAILTWAAYTLIGRVVLRQISVIAATTYGSLWGLLMLAIGALFELPQVHWSAVTWPVVLGILYIGAFGTVAAFVWYYEGVKTLGPSRAAIFMNLVPVFGVALSALLLGESILVSMVVGGLITIAGVMLTSRAPAK